METRARAVAKAARPVTCSVGQPSMVWLQSRSRNFCSVQCLTEDAELLEIAAEAEA